MKPAKKIVITMLTAVLLIVNLAAFAGCDGVSVSELLHPTTKQTTPTDAKPSIVTTTTTTTTTTASNPNIGGEENIPVQGEEVVVISAPEENNDQQTTTAIGSTPTTSLTTARTTAARTTAKTIATTVKTTTKRTTAATTAAKPVILKYGMTSDEVVALQKRLKELGYFTATCTGYYGTQTEAAVREFQKANGLTPDGEAGPATINKLYSPDVIGYITIIVEPTTASTAKPTTTKNTTAATTASTTKATTASTTKQTTPSTTKTAATTTTTTTTKATTTTTTTTTTKATTTTTTKAPEPARWDTKEGVKRALSKCASYSSSIGCTYDSTLNASNCGYYGSASQVDSFCFDTEAQFVAKCEETVRFYGNVKGFTLWGYSLTAAYGGYSAQLYFG